MKNLYKIIGLVFVLVTIFFNSFSFNIASADVTVYVFSESMPPYIKHGDYSTLIQCNNARDQYFAGNGLVYGTGAGVCTAETRSGLPIITETPTLINGTSTTESGVVSSGSTYKLLAPIAGLTEAPDNMGDYFNKIFTLAIALCGALAVIMIVIGGVQYMGNDSIFGKTEAKSKILASILGLLIALGSYALLNTINPDLLGGKGVNIAQVTVDLGESAPMTQESTEIPAPGVPLGRQGKCPQGVGNVVVGTTTVMHTCATISTKVATLINMAKMQNPSINLSGNAFRSYNTQMDFRKKYCADPINTPVNSCKPPTAFAGTSNHESGLAIDFMCDGQFINIGTGKDAENKRPETRKCWDFLVANAYTVAGLTNLPTENWHWSVGGF